MPPSVLFVALGSRGDVGPALQVARAIRARGADARLAVGSDYVAQVEAAGFEAVDLGVAVGTLLADAAGQRWAQAQGRRETTEATTRLFAELVPRAAEAVVAAVRPGETIVSGIMTFALGAALAEAYGNPHVQLLFMPLTRTREAGATAFPVLPGASALNRWSGGLAQRFTERTGRSWSAEVRAGLGLAPWSPDDHLAALARTPVLYGVSPQFVVPAHDWPAHVRVSGHLLGNEEPVVPRGLPEFLAAHRGVVYVGLGSFSDTIFARDWPAVRDALALGGWPAVVATGTTAMGLADATTPVFPVTGVSHAWLFQRLAGVVHHAGAGTTQRATRAGVPSVTVPVVGDQPYWARRIKALGLGPRPLPHARLTAERLAARIEEMLTDGQLAHRARELAHAMSVEDGPARAAEFVLAAGRP